MTRLKLDAIDFDLSPGWACSAIMLYDGSSPPRGDPPIVPTLVLARRPEIAPGDSLDEVLAQDLAVLESQHRAFALREQDRFTLGKSEARALEFDFTDARGTRLRQRIILRWVGSDLYTITATAHPDEAFGAVRTTLERVAESLSRRV